jgi:hypothetical protein
LNPRPLGYEPYDMRLPRLKPSLADAVTSADRTDLISLGRLRLPVSGCLAASGLQNGLQNRRLICGLLHPSVPLLATTVARIVTGILRLAERLRGCPWPWMWRLAAMTPQ